MEFNKKQCFSIRKYTVGVVSVLIGVMFSVQIAAADTSQMVDSAATDVQIAASQNNTDQEESSVHSSAIHETASENEIIAAPEEKEQASFVNPNTEEQPNTASAADYSEISKSETSAPETEEKAEVQAVSEEKTEEARTSNESEKTKSLKDEQAQSSANTDEKKNSQAIAQTTVSNKSVFSETETATNQKDQIAAADTAALEETDLVRVLVKLKEEEISPDNLKTAQAIQERIADTEIRRQQILKELDERGIQYKKLYDFDLFFNGFLLETSYKEAKLLQTLEDIDSLEISPKAAKSASDENEGASQTAASPQVIDSSQIINVQPLWDNNIKGQGQVIAIIDSGLDVEHDNMHISDLSTARYQSAEEIEALKKNLGINYGKWVNEKVVYAFNYNDWDDQIKEASPQSHGTFVTGMAAGNPSAPAPNGEYVTGVAPEAQIIFMRVFSDVHEGTHSYIYMKALEDAVKLGADTINLSLGSEAASSTELPSSMTKALLLARQAGVTVTVAAGNSKVYGFGQSAPKTSHPDYGLVSSPAVARDVIGVGALNNSVENIEVVTVEQLKDRSDFDNGLLKIFAYETKKLATDQEYQCEWLGEGSESDVAEKDLKGKLALVVRNQQVSVGESIRLAKEAGAAGIILINDSLRAEYLGNEGLDNEVNDFPIIVIGERAGNELAQHAGEYSLKFDGKRVKVPYRYAGAMLGYSSWGLSADGYLKPDLIATGGKVYSAINDNRYDTDSGTSFSSPQVAGAAALIQQVLKERFETIQGSDLQDLVKNLSMSNADPHFDKTAGAYTSPRRQGAGVLNAAKAAYGEVYATGSDHYGSLSLGNVEDNFSLSVTLHNLSQEDKQVTYRTVLNTDQIHNDIVTLKPRLLEETESEESFTLPAGGSLTLDIPVDASSFSQELAEQFPNGYYLEGFVFFNDAETGEKLASIPYVGFKGEFQNLAAMEKPIYDFSEDEKPFYYYKAGTQVKDPANNFTALVSHMQLQGRDMEQVLGEHYDADSNQYFYYGQYLAFSPNNDQILDDVALKAVFLRNYDNLQVSVYSADDLERQYPIYQAGNESDIKTFYGYGVENKAVVLNATNWKGRDQDGNLVPDGHYQYVVRYRPNATGSKEQEIVLDVIVDTQAPELFSGESYYDDQSRIITFSGIQENGSGLASLSLNYSQAGQHHRLSANADGSFTLPEGVKVDDLQLILVDYAGNTKVLYFSVKNDHLLVYDFSKFKQHKDFAKKTNSLQPDSLSDGNTSTIQTDGSLQVAFFLDNHLESDYSSLARYIVTNEKGERMTGEFAAEDEASLPSLPFGRYKVELIMTAEDIELLSSSTVTLEINETSPNRIVSFCFRTIETNKFDIIFDQDAPSSTRITATDQNGQTYEFNRSLFDRVTFEKRLKNGLYHVEVFLPEDYEADQMSFDYEVTNKINTYHLSLPLPRYIQYLSASPDSDLAGELDFGSAKVHSETEFSVKKGNNQALLDQVKNNADLSKQNVTIYRLSLQRNQKEVEIEGTKQLHLSGLTGKNIQLYWSDGQGGLQNVTSYFTNGELNLPIHKLGSLVLLSEKEVTPQDRQKLQKKIEIAMTILATSAYQSDSEEKQKAYEKALIDATEALTNPNTSYEDFQEAMKKLQEAQDALLETDPSVKPSSKDSNTIQSSKKSSRSSSSASSSARSEQEDKRNVAADKEELPKTGRQQSLIASLGILTVTVGVSFLTVRRFLKK